MLRNGGWSIRNRVTSQIYFSKTILGGSGVMPPGKILQNYTKKDANYT